MTSNIEYYAILMVASFAAFARYATIMYGRKTEKLRNPREIAGSVMIASVVGVMLYAIVTDYKGELTLLQTLFLGGTAGLFTEVFLRFGPRIADAILSSLTKGDSNDNNRKSQG